jgi:hypothetical protein
MNRVTAIGYCSGLGKLAGRLRRALCVATRVQNALAVIGPVLVEIAALARRTVDAHA